MKREWRIQNNKCIKRWLPYKSCRYSRSSPQQHTSKRQPVGFNIVIIEHRHRTIWENWPREQRYDMVSWSNVGSRVTILYVRERERETQRRRLLGVVDRYDDGIERKESCLGYPIIIIIMKGKREYGDGIPIRWSATMFRVLYLSMPIQKGPSTCLFIFHINILNKFKS